MDFFRVLYTVLNTIPTLEKRNTRIIWGPELLSRDLKLENALLESCKNIETLKIEMNLAEGRHKLVLNSVLEAIQKVRAL